MAALRKMQRALAPGRGDDEVGELPRRGLEHRQLQGLLGSEVGEKAAFGHPGATRQGADTQALEALHAGLVERLGQDGLAGLLALGHGTEIKTNGRFVKCNSSSWTQNEWPPRAAKWPPFARHTGF
jgi:hypothetical protein